MLCARCVMDTSDPAITFDAEGICNHCREQEAHVRADSQRRGTEGGLEAILDQIKAQGAGKQYDCVIGVSGGVDSSYVCLVVKRMGLRPLAVHLDNGWDSEGAVHNIERLVRRLEIDLYTEVLDWEAFRDLQLAFLKASTPDCEIPTDHAIWATLRRMAHKTGVRFIISGANTRTETHLPTAWSQGHIDWGYIKSVHRQFGTVPLRTFPRLDLWSLRRYREQRVIPILNYLDYIKNDAIAELQREVGWEPYGGKHHESIYTRFYQGYILPRKFGYDKRRNHFSSLICSGQMSREAALEELGHPPYSPRLQDEDREYVVKKLGITPADFEQLMHAPKKTFWDYDSYAKQLETPLFKALRGVYKIAGKFGLK